VANAEDHRQWLTGNEPDQGRPLVRFITTVFDAPNTRPALSRFESKGRSAARQTRCEIASREKIKDIVMNAIINGPEAVTEDIRFGFGECSLGTVLVAASRKGVCAILMGNDRLALGRELAEAFPHARLVSREEGIEEMVAQVLVFLDAPHQGLNLPLDIRGSALEQAVWQALRDVPPGQTVSYGQIARTLSLPATAQDVGAACAANVLAVAIPCHRVVKVDGSISGYRWGVRRKRELLNREGTRAAMTVDVRH
jgi:AraC family transcriptional regulator of adaptative response/methylated-DNA-[protein]-cysteine methyltransferase